MQYIVKSNLKHDGVDYQADEIVDMDNESAKTLVEDGIIAPFRGVETKAERTAPVKPVAKTAAQKKKEEAEKRAEEEKKAEVDEDEESDINEDEDSSDDESDSEKKVVNTGDDL